MSSTEKTQGSGAVNKSTLLQQVRGSMTCIEKLSPDNIAKVAEVGLSYERVREILNDAGIDIEKIIVDPTRFIYNVYYADYERGIYFDIHLAETALLDERFGVAKIKEMVLCKDDALKAKDWHLFYHRDVPGPLKIYDFQKRYKDIEPEQVYEVWEEIHRNLDYENGQWREEVLDYVFNHAPKPKQLPPLNDKGLITVFRGSGTLSQAPERALSWSSSQHSALWFANHNGCGQAMYIGEVAPEDVVNYLHGFRNENEVIVRRGKVQNIRVADMIPVDTDAMVKLLAPVLPELLKFGPQVEKHGYPSEGFFEHHGRSHILRVLTLSLIYYYNSGRKLSERDKNILIYFSLLHDVGRTNEDVDVNHGKASVEKIEGEGLVVDGLNINKRDRQLTHIIIKYHSHSDEDGMNAIRRRKKKHSSEEYFRLIDLYAICKDMDGLDRVRFNGLDVYQLRTTYARKLPLIAGALLKEKIERFVMDPPKE